MGLDTSLRNVIRDVVKDEVRAVVREELRAVRPALVDPIAAEAEYLTIDRAAEMAGVRPPTVRSWVERGDLPGHRAGRLLRVKSQELQAFMARGPVCRNPALDLDSRAEAILAKGRARR